VIEPAAILLDNEAVQALRARSHPKHRRVIGLLRELQLRGDRRRMVVRVLVPVAVRIESAWDRRSTEAAGLNLLSRAEGVDLDQGRADRAAQLRAETGVSVVDATVAEAAESAPSPTVILTSDVGDMRRLAAHLRGGAHVVRI
jgi:hypothetical protein